MTQIYDFAAPLLNGAPETLERYRGKVLLIVNVASKCGFTPQYAGLEALYLRYRPSGFAVLGFPCNQFGHQEPGDAEAIGSLCRLTYGVSFPVFGKIAVNGADAHPLFKHLKAAQPGLLGTQAIKWNFTKFLVDRSGTVAARFAPSTKPHDLGSAIERLL